MLSFLKKMVVKAPSTSTPTPSIQSLLDSDTNPRNYKKTLQYPIHTEIQDTPKIRYPILRSAAKYSSTPLQKSHVDRLNATSFSNCFTDISEMMDVHPAPNPRTSLFPPFQNQLIQYIYFKIRICFYYPQYQC